MSIIIIIIIFIIPGNRRTVKADCINSSGVCIFYINVLTFQFAECVTLISTQHNWSLVSFINQLMHSIDTVVDVKICVVQKSKRQTLKITPACFGSRRIHHQGLMACTWLKLHIMFHMCLLCVRSEFGGIYAAKIRSHT